MYIKFVAKTFIKFFENFCNKTLHLRHMYIGGLKKRG